MGIMNEFYPLYSAFIEDESSGLGLLESTAGDIIADERTLELWKGDLSKLFNKERADGAGIASFILKTGDNPRTEMVLAEALLDSKLSYGGFKFLAAAYPLFVKRRG